MHRTTKSRFPENARKDSYPNSFCCHVNQIFLVQISIPLKGRLSETIYDCVFCNSFYLLKGGKTNVTSAWGCKLQKGKEQTSSDIITKTGITFSKDHGIECWSSRSLEEMFPNNFVIKPLLNNFCLQV